MGAVRIDVVDDPAACRIAERIQRLAWGMPDRGIVPAEQIRAVVHNGGLLLLARDGHRDEPVGFCYGFVGLDAARPILCSHMLAVRPEHRSRGIGRALKLEQRRHATTRGFASITWTFDPLQARNAYLNLHRLGAFARRYHVDHYGPMDDAINAGLPTDRLLAEWPIDDSVRPTADMRAGSASSETAREIDEPTSERPAIDGSRAKTPDALGVPWLLAPADSDTAIRPGRHDPAALRADVTLVAVPADIDALRLRDPASGPQWRAALRTALTAAIDAGMVAVDMALDPDGRCHAYVLERRALERRT